MKNYIELQTVNNPPKYPRIERLNKEIKNSVYGYVDKMELAGLDIFLQFMCNNKGLPIGKIWNSYFDRDEIPNQTEDFWLIEYKKELLNRIVEDLENRKVKIR